jgi:parallel beta-helix repeat protein
MRDRFRCGLLLVLLTLSLINGVTGASEVQAQTREYIFIRANGAIECTNPGYSVPIETTDNVTYTITGNIGTDYAITVERDHIVLDGGDHTLESRVTSGSDYRDYTYFHQRGIDLLGRRNVTVRNLDITYFQTAIWNQGVNTTIRGVHCTSAGEGIFLGHSSYATIVGNQFLDVLRPISLATASGDHHYNISYNTIVGPLVGIGLTYLSSSVIRENRIMASSNGYGAQGMSIHLCTENTIAGNTITNMSYHALVLTGSSNNTIVDNTITDNTQYGLQFFESPPYPSSDNLVRGNLIARHNGYGIMVGANCEHNTFYYNTIEANGVWFDGNQVDVAEGTENVWDDGSRGNYWSDYTGYDQDDDGIGDTPYEIDLLNRDHYPLTTRVRTPTAITCTITPSALPAYSTLTLEGAITPRVGAVTVTLTFVQPDSTTVSVPVTSLVDSVYYATYTPTIVGDWSVSASWAGDAEYETTTSPPATFSVSPQVSKVQTSLTIQSSEGVYCRGAQIIITGTTSPALADETITLTFNIDTGLGGNTFNATTTSAGSYQWSGWSSDNSFSSGTYEVWASWTGNTTHHDATSGAISFIVRSPTITFPYPICCFIATATYGSELAPEVQFLRNFRADTVLTTFTGRQFMAVFNAIYYSFSPQVASGIASHDGFRAVARGVLFPLIRILQVGEWVTQRFAISPDLGIVAFVLLVSALLSLVYLVPWALLLSAWRRYTIPTRVVRRGRDLLMGSIGLLLLAIALQVPVLTIAGGALTVLLTAGLTVITATRAITQRALRCATHATQ